MRADLMLHQVKMQISKTQTTDQQEFYILNLYLNQRHGCREYFENCA